MDIKTEVALDPSSSATTDDATDIGNNTLNMKNIEKDNIELAEEHLSKGEIKGPLARLYVWALEMCDTRFSVVLLGILSFTESCIFIIPPEVMLLPMSYARRKKAFYFALITTITSVLGAIAGYYIGLLFWQEVSPFIFKYIPGFARYFDHVGNLYQENAVSALFLAAFTPIPFKVFTVVAGVYSTKIALTTLVITSLLGRGARYFILSGIVYLFGEKAQEIIEKHFRLATLVIMVLGIAFLVFLKMRH